jgi:hypothetical protein
MKTNILNSTIALLLAGLPLAQAQDDSKIDEGKEGKKIEKSERKENRSSATVTAQGSGEVTIEMDVNGKKERKTFKLDGNQPFTWKLEDGGAGAVARAGELLRAHKIPGGKMEKVTWLGLATQPVGDEVRAQLPLQPGEGLTVRHIMPDSPAAKAGLAEHDILTRLDDQILVSTDQLHSLVKMRKPGDSVKIAYLRKGEKKETTATLVEHESEVFRGDAFQLFKDGKGGVIFGEGGRERIKELEERLRDMKGKIPGMIVDKKSFLIGPDGVVKKYSAEKIEELMDNLRKQVDNLQTSPEAREEVRKTVEEALRNAREAVEKVEDLVKKNQEEKPQPKP